MRIVIALGGNALLKRGEPLGVEVQRANIRRACASIAPLIAKHTVILTHGNGPQVGLLALQAAAFKQVDPYPLDVLGAESEGMIGYLLEQEMLNASPTCRAVNLITQTLVDQNDPAFQDPTKFIGPIYSEAEAIAIAKNRSWIVKADGQSFRRVVPSPLPLEILALDAISTLSAAGFLVICTGGGGVPVIRGADGILKGVEAVIDKDRASALLACQLDADALLLLTDVDAVYRDWGTPNQSAIRHATVAELQNDSFAAGSMGPKVDAAIDFARETGKFAAIGSLEQIGDLLCGAAGTLITNSASTIDLNTRKIV